MKKGSLDPWSGTHNNQCALSLGAGGGQKDMLKIHVSVYVGELGSTLPDSRRSEAEVSALQETLQHQGILGRKLFCSLESTGLEGKKAMQEPESVTQQQVHQWHVGICLPELFGCFLLDND